MAHLFCIAHLLRHQPRLAIWRLLSNVLVLSKGRQLFFGPPKGAEEWFTTRLGLSMPADTTPVDFIVDQVNIDFGAKGDIYGKEYNGRHQGQQQQRRQQLRTVHDIDAVRVLCRLVCGLQGVGEQAY